VSGRGEDVVVEYVDHLHEHFRRPGAHPQRSPSRPRAARIERRDPPGVAGALPVSGRSGMGGTHHHTSREVGP
jgi:hypothetical protein